MLMLRKAKPGLRGNWSLRNRSFFNFFFFLCSTVSSEYSSYSVRRRLDCLRHSTTTEGADDVHWRLFLTQPVSPLAQRQLSTIYPLRGELVYNFFPSVWTSLHSTFDPLVVSNPFCDFYFHQLLQTVNDSAALRRTIPSPNYLLYYRPLIDSTTYGINIEEE